METEIREGANTQCIEKRCPLFKKKAKGAALLWHCNFKSSLICRLEIFGLLTPCCGKLQLLIFAGQALKGQIPLHPPPLNREFCLPSRVTLGWESSEMFHSGEIRTKPSSNPVQGISFPQGIFQKGRKELDRASYTRTHYRRRCFF